MTFAVADTSFGDNEKKVEHGFDLESDTESNHHRKSVKILDYTNHCCGLEKDRSLVYTDIINFEKGSSPCSVPNQSRCVMCGVSDALIPTQNKNVCKSCDSVPWLVKCPAVVVKFCKGCKNFVVLADFSEKPGAAKCAKCRLRGRNNYLKSKKNTCVEYKNEADPDSLTSFTEEEESEMYPRPPFLPSENVSVQVLGIDISGIGAEILHSLNDTSCPVLHLHPAVSDNKTSPPKIICESDIKKDSIGAEDPSMSQITDYSPFLFMTAQSPVDLSDPLSMSCSSTYNANCNYNTSRKSDSHSDLVRDFKNEFRSDSKDDLNPNVKLNMNLNTEGKGRTRIWSSVDCDTVSAHRPPPPHPHTKKTKSSSIAKGSHHNVHFHLPDSAIGNVSQSLSSISKPSPAFAFSPFLSFCLRETMLESRGTKNRLEPASNPPSAPTSPPFSSSRPPSCQLVDRWQWDPDANPLMQLVLASETFGPHSPFKFSPHKRLVTSSPKKCSPNYEKYFLPQQTDSNYKRLGLREIDAGKKRGILGRLILDKKIENTEEKKVVIEEVAMLAELEEGKIEDEKNEIDDSIDFRMKVRHKKNCGKIKTFSACDLLHDDDGIRRDHSICAGIDDSAPSASEREKVNLERSLQGYSLERCTLQLSLRAEMFAAASVSFRELSRLYMSIPSSSPTPSSSSCYDSISYADTSAETASTSSHRYLKKTNVPGTPCTRCPSGDESDGEIEDNEGDYLTTTEECYNSDKESACPTERTDVEESKETDDRRQLNLRPSGKKKKGRVPPLFSASKSCDTSPADSTNFGSQSVPDDLKHNLADISFDCYSYKDDGSSIDRDGNNDGMDKEFSLPALALEELEQWYLKWAPVMEGAMTD